MRIHSRLLTALALGATGLGQAQAADSQWPLTTADTSLTVAVVANKPCLTAFQNPTQNWNWLPAACDVPLPGKGCIKAGGNDVVPQWVLADATEDRSAGHTVTLRFTNADPALELKSVWRALPGPGPVENEVTVVNQSSIPVTFVAISTRAASVQLVADAPIIAHWAQKTAAGFGKVEGDFAVSGGMIRSRDIPFLLLGAGMTHGVYLGFEWELGGFEWGGGGGSDPLRIRCHVSPLGENVERGPGGVFVIPSVYYGTYQGDFDDGANRFKRWFWNHKITRSLHDNPNEPWVEVCMQEPAKASGSAGVTGNTRQEAYDLLAAAGAECVKMDYWDGSGKCWYTDRDWTFRPEVWPNGFDFATKAHKAGLKASLYMGGTYNDADLNTLAGRDAELAAVQERYDKGWFDMWRTDRYSAPKDPMPDTYEGVANFLYIQDRLIEKSPGYRYENCCNGGKYKGFAICRRMTLCTMNDVDKDPIATRTTFYTNSYAINPVQLKSDLGPASTAYEMRTHMLGAILSWAADNPVYRQHIALYKEKQRPILRGANVYHILPMADGTEWDGLQYYNPDLEKGSVFLFKPSVLAFDGDAKAIKLKGLDRQATYTLTFQDRTNLNCVATGAKLMTDGIMVSGMTGNRASEIIWLERTAGTTKP